MASASRKTDDNEQWQNAQVIHDQHQWKDSSDDDDVDNHEFFDAHDTDFKHEPSSPTTTNVNAEANLLHERLNAQLSTDETVTKKKSPGWKNFFLRENLEFFVF